MKTKKIILALYVGIIALSSVGLSFSLAWYANSTRLQVSGFNLTIDTEDSLKINTVADLDSSVDNIRKDINYLFTPVTTAHSSSWVSQKSANPVFFDDTMGNVDLDLKVINSGYFTQEFYLFSDNDVYVTIDPEGTFIDPNYDLNLSHARTVYENAQRSTNPADEFIKSLTIEEINERLNILPEAMRFSVLVPEVESYQYAIIDPHKDEDVYQGGLLDNDIDRYYDSELIGSEYCESVIGDVNDRSLIVYDDAESADSDYQYPGKEPSAFNAKHKANVKRFNKEASIANGLVIQKENALSLDQFDNAHRPFAPLLIPVHKERPTKIVISMYLEGWDEVSINSTMGSNFIADLKFQIARRMD